MSTILLSINNHTGDGNIEKLHESGETLQQSYLSDNYLFKNCLAINGLGMLSTNGSYQDLRSFLECALLSEGTTGLRPLVMEEHNFPHQQSYIIQSTIPQGIGYMCMYGNRNNLPETNVVLKNVINPKEHKLILCPQTTTDVKVIIIRDNEQVDIDNIHGDIYICQLDILPLTCNFFSQKKLTSIRKALDASTKNQKTSFGNNVLFQLAPIVTFTQNPVINRKFKPNLIKTTSMKSTFKIAKQQSYNPITHMQNGLQHTIIALFQDTPLLMCNPNRTFDLVMSCDMCTVELQNLCKKNCATNMLCKVSGQIGAYGIVGCDILHEHATLGKYLNGPEDLNLLSDVLHSSLQSRNNSLTHSTQLLPEIDDEHFFTQTAASVEAIAKQCEGKTQTKYYTYEDPKINISDAEFTKTLHVTRVMFLEEDQLSTKHQNTSKSENTKILLNVKHKTGKTQNIKNLPKSTTKHLSHFYSVEQLEINCELLEPESTVVIPFNSIGSQLVCQASWKDSHSNERSTLKENTQTSLLTPGPHCFIIRKHVNKYGTYVSLIVLPLSDTQLNGTKNPLFYDGFHDATLSTIHEPKINFPQEIATQFSDAQIYKSTCEPSTIFMSQLCLEPYNYMLQYNDMMTLSKSAKSHVQNIHVLSLETCERPTPSSHLKLNDQKITNVPFYIKNSIKPSKLTGVPRTVDGHTTYAPSSIFSMHIIDHADTQLSCNKPNIYTRNSLHECMRVIPQKPAGIFQTVAKFNQTEKHGTHLLFCSLPTNLIDKDYICMPSDEKSRIHCVTYRENEYTLENQQQISFSMQDQITHGIDVAKLCRDTFGGYIPQNIANIVTQCGSFQRNPLSHSIIPVGVSHDQFKHPNTLDESVEYSLTSPLITPIAGVQTFVSIIPMSASTCYQNSMSSKHELPITSTKPIHKKQLTRKLDIKLLFSMASELLKPRPNSSLGKILLKIAKALKTTTKLITSNNKCYRLLIDEIECRYPLETQQQVNNLTSQWSTIIANGLLNTSHTGNEHNILQFLNYGLQGLLQHTLTSCNTAIEQIIFVTTLMSFAYDMISVTTKLQKISKSYPHINPEQQSTRLKAIENKLGLRQSRRIKQFVLTLGIHTNSIISLLTDTIALLDSIGNQNRLIIEQAIKQSFISSILDPQLHARKDTDVLTETDHRLKSDTNPALKKKINKNFDFTIESSSIRLSDIIAYLDQTPGKHIEITRKILVDLKLYCEASMQEPVLTPILESFVHSLQHNNK